MYIKEIEYKDYNGLDCKTKLYFNLNEAELTKMQFKRGGGYQEYLKRIVDSNDIEEIAYIFDELLMMAYGVKSDDGKRFEKTDKIREEFRQSEAYSVYYMMLLTDADEAARFVDQILPRNIAEAVRNAKEDMAKN